MITLKLIDMRFYAHHGCFAEEQEIGAHFSVDVEIDASFTQQAAESDQLEDALNYQGIYNVVAREMRQPSHLLEHLAGRILLRLTSEYPQSGEIKVSVSKINPPLGGQVGASRVVLTSA